MKHKLLYCLLLLGVGSGSSVFANSDSPDTRNVITITSTGQASLAADEAYLNFIVTSSSDEAVEAHKKYLKQMKLLRGILTTNHLEQDEDEDDVKPVKKISVHPHNEDALDDVEKKRKKDNDDEVETPKTKKNRGALNDDDEVETPKTKKKNRGALNDDVSFITSWFKPEIIEHGFRAGANVSSGPWQAGRPSIVQNGFFYSSPVSIVFHNINKEGTRPFQSYLGKLLDRLSEHSLLSNNNDNATRVANGMMLEPPMIIKYSNSDSSCLFNLAYQNAIDKATSRAKSMAKTLNRTLGRALVVHEISTLENNNVSRYNPEPATTSDISCEVKLAIEFELKD